MGQSITVITPPASEPVTLTEAKLHLRVDVSDDDTLITALISAAREEVERESWHALYTQTLELTLDQWPGYSYLHSYRPPIQTQTYQQNGYIQLPRPPLQSITSITYKDVTGAVNTWSPSAYTASTNTIPAQISPVPTQMWPSVTLWPIEAIRIRYVAGWTDVNLVPKLLKQAMLLCIGYWYENREEGQAPRAYHELSLTVERLVRSYRQRAKIR